MEPPQLVSLAGRPRVSRKRDKNEALKRQTEWVAPRRGRKMTCSTCGIPGHNARGCEKFNKISDEGEGTSKGGLFNKKNKKCNKRSDKGECTSNGGQLKGNQQKMDKQCNKGNKKIKERHRTLIDEEDVESSPPTSQNAAAVENFSLSAPHPSKDVATVEHFMYDPSPWKGTTSATTWKGTASATGRMLQQLRVEQMDKGKKQLQERHRTLIDEEYEPDFDLGVEPDFGLGVEEYIPWKPRAVSELKSRIQERQKQAHPTGSRRISFVDDLGTSIDFYAPTGLTWKGNTSITGKMLEQLRVKKLKVKKDNGKA